MLISAKTQLPLDLTTATEIKGIFTKEDGSALTVTKTGLAISVTSAIGGTISIVLTAAQTALLKASEKQNFEIEVTRGGKADIVQIASVLNVRLRLVD
jgi:hypothetical protein